MKYKAIFTNWRVIILLFFLMLSVIAIHPNFHDGVTIRSVASNSTAANGGMVSPSPKLTPVAKERIIGIDQHEIHNLADYYAAVSGLAENQTVRIQTNEKVYTLVVHDPSDLGLRVSEVARTNLRKGLDLEGGIRVLLTPEGEISQDDLDSTVASLKERLNVYGLSDVTVRPASDLSGKDYILVEIAGVTEEDVKSLLAKQGKFEAKIGNQTVFFGGKKDITYVCRSAECSGIDPNRGCVQAAEGYACSFFFGITLSPEAAQRQADLTAPLSVTVENGNRYLSEDIVLYLDDVEVDRLKIGAELKGRPTTNIQISGSGAGRVQQEALTNSLSQMKKLQTIIITGSLPTKLEVVKLDTISPTLGQEFLNNVILIGILAVITAVLVVYVRYRKAKIVLPMALIFISEMFLILGFAAFVGWNLDLLAIAGIIIVAGTGVDHLVIITDETIRGESTSNWKQKFKAAMFIVMGAYLTNLSGMIPLLWAGAGLVKGFALTSIAGLTFGVLVARSAYAAIIEILLKD